MLLSSHFTRGVLGSAGARESAAFLEAFEVVAMFFTRLCF